MWSFVMQTGSLIIVNRRWFFVLYWHAWEIRAYVDVFSVYYMLRQRPEQGSVQFSSVTQSCPTLFDPMNHSTPGLPVHHQLPEFTQTHAHRVGDAIQPSHPLSSPSPLAPDPSQPQGLFQWVNSSHEVAKVVNKVKGGQSLDVVFPLKNGKIKTLSSQNLGFIF